MKKRSTEKDIKDVMAEERSRGKRRIDREAEEETRRLEKEYLQVIREGNVRRFKKILSGLELPEASEKYRRIMELWNSVQKEKKL